MIITIERLKEKRNKEIEKKQNKNNSNDKKNTMKNEGTPFRKRK